MVDTVKFSEFLPAGTQVEGQTIVGISGGVNSKFTTAPQFLDQGTTAERPAVPTESMIRYNTDLSLYEFYNGTIWTQFEDSADIALLIARLAAHTVGDGASMIGLENQTGVTSKTVQDLAEATILAKTDNGTLTNGQFLDDLATGFLSSTTTTGVVASRVLTGTADEINITHGSGSGTPSIFFVINH